MEINKELLETLLVEAKENPRLRQNFDLRTSSADTSQRMLCNHKQRCLFIDMKKHQKL